MDLEKGQGREKGSWRERPRRRGCLHHHVNKVRLHKWFSLNSFLNKCIKTLLLQTPWLHSHVSLSVCSLMLLGVVSLSSDDLAYSLHCLRKGWAWPTWPGLPETFQVSARKAPRSRKPLSPVSRERRVIYSMLTMDYSSRLSSFGSRVVFRSDLLTALHMFSLVLIHPERHKHT